MQQEVSHHPLLAALIGVIGTNCFSSLRKMWNLRVAFEPVTPELQGAAVLADCAHGRVIKTGGTLRADLQRDRNIGPIRLASRWMISSTIIAISLLIRCGSSDTVP